MVDWTRLDTRAEALDDLRFSAGKSGRSMAAHASLSRATSDDQQSSPSFIHQITAISARTRRQSRFIRSTIMLTKKREIIQGLIRHIEYSSNADFCYMTRPPMAR